MRIVRTPGDWWGVCSEAELALRVLAGEQTRYFVIEATCQCGAFWGSETGGLLTRDAIERCSTPCPIGNRYRCAPLMERNVGILIELAARALAGE